MSRAIRATYSRFSNNRKSKPSIIGHFSIQTKSPAIDDKFSLITSTFLNLFENKCSYFLNKVYSSAWLFEESC